MTAMIPTAGRQGIGYGGIKTVKKLLIEDVFRPQKLFYNLLTKKDLVPRKGYLGARRFNKAGRCSDQGSGARDHGN